MLRSLRQVLDDPSDTNTALLESQLLGALMLAPYLRLDACMQTLRASDFASPHRGAAFTAIMIVRHPALGLVGRHLEATGVPPPPGRTGWGDALARVLDVAFVEDDAVPDAVRAIKEAAVSRKAARRLSAA